MLLGCLWCQWPGGHLSGVAAPVRLLEGAALSQVHHRLVVGVERRVLVLLRRVEVRRRLRHVLSVQRIMG